MNGDDVKNKAHVIIEGGIRDGLSDQQIVQALKKEKIRSFSEEDVARIRASLSR